jgi:hypothetical protein
VAIAFGTVGAFGISTGSSVVPALPASVAQDDFLIGHVSGRTTTAITPPSGWSLLTSQANAETPNTTLFILWKYAVSGETAPTVAITGSGVACAISRWTGVPVRANPWLITPVKQQGSGTTMTGLTMTMPTITNAMAIWFWSQDNNGITSTVTNSATVAYGGSSYNTTTIPSGTNASAAYKLVSTGATGATNMTSASGTQNMFIGCALDPTPVLSFPPIFPSQAGGFH